jgi:hypothetical protein
MTFRLEPPLNPGPVIQEVQEFYLDQDQRRYRLEAIQTRRRELDQEPAEQPPLQIEFAPAKATNLPLTVETQPLINASSNCKGKL